MEGRTFQGEAISSLASPQSRVVGHQAGKQAEASGHFGLGLWERRLERRAVEWEDWSSILDITLVIV